MIWLTTIERVSWIIHLYWKTRPRIWRIWKPQSNNKSNTKSKSKKTHRTQIFWTQAQATCKMEVKRRRCHSSRQISPRQVLSPAQKQHRAWIWKGFSRPTHPGFMWAKREALHWMHKTWRSRSLDKWSDKTYRIDCRNLKMSCKTQIELWMIRKKMKNKRRSGVRCFHSNRPQMSAKLRCTIAKWKFLPNNSISSLLGWKATIKIPWTHFNRRPREKFRISTHKEHREVSQQ